MPGIAGPVTTGCSPRPSGSMQPGPVRRPMSSPLTRELLRHGQAGCLFLGLVPLHHELNAGWYRPLSRRRQGTGKASSPTAAGVLADFVCTINGLLIAASLVLAGEVFALVPQALPWWGRSLHSTATAWILVLASELLVLHGHRLAQNSASATPPALFFAGPVRVSVNASCRPIGAPEPAASRRARH